jgi:COP9 signalosome complex subunit 6
LDLVGWFTATPPSGPELCHLPIHRQLLQDYNETAILLAFHPSALTENSSTGGKLPLTIYETIYEGDSVREGDKSMQIDDQEPSLSIKLRELPYSIETGEAEMISVDFVAKGVGNATAIQAQVPSPAPQAEVSAKPSRDKKRVKDSPALAEEAPEEDTSPLSPEDEDCTHKTPSFKTFSCILITFHDSNCKPHNPSQCGEDAGIASPLNQIIPLIRPWFSPWYP